MVRRFFREPRRCDCWTVSDQTENVQSLFPLPGGEGQGEGER